MERYQGGNPPEHPLTSPAHHPGDEAANEASPDVDPTGLAASAFELSRQGMVITAPDLNILHANRAFCAMTGYELEEIVGKPPGFLNPGAHNQASFQDMWAVLAARGYWQGEVWERRRDGTAFPAWLTLSKAMEGGTLRHLVGNLSDITEKKSAETRASYLSLQTGLPDRGMFLDRLSWAIAAAHRRRQRLGVLVLSLDISRPISIDVRDVMLSQACSRLQHAVRGSDAVARLDANKLAVLLDDLSSTHHAEWATKKVLWAVRQPYLAAERETRMDVSIGVAMFPFHDTDGVGLLNKAERAMNEVRGKGKNNFEIFSPQLFSCAP